MRGVLRSEIMVNDVLCVVVYKGHDQGNGPQADQSWDYQLHLRPEPTSYCAARPVHQLMD